MEVLAMMLALGLCGLGGGIATPAPHGMLVEWSGSSWDRTSTTTSKESLDRVKTYTPEDDLPLNFRDILVVGDSLMIAGRNKVVNVSLDTYTENKRIQWEAESISSEVCKAQYSEEECQNYIRVLAEQDNGDLFVCGTHANNPRCRAYASKHKGYQQMEDRAGVGISPRTSHHNNTAIYTEGRIFAAGFTDAQGSDPLIYSDLSPKPIRTEQFDSQWLNNPNFVGSFEHEDKAYFLFHENAVEHINCGKARFSRIARVCKNDKGGLRVLRHTWTSFFKSRLNCSIPGEYPFNFDEIQAVSALGEGNFRPSILASEKEEMFYAIFSTLPNSIPGMAVCAFRMQDVLKTFEGPFKEQEEPHFNWLPATNVPKPHPSKTCANNSHNISDSAQDFIKKHPLMDKAVPAFGGQPILIRAGFNYRMTKIAVDWRVQSAEDKFYDVLYIGTDDGRVLKAINRGWPSRIDTIIIEDMKVYEDGSPVVNLHVHRSPTGARHLVVLSESQVKAVPLERCSAKRSCSACVALQDPYCSWTKEAGCSTVPTPDSIQSVDQGQHPSCQLDQSSASSTAHVSTPTQTPTESAPPPCDCSPQAGTQHSGTTTMAATTTERRLVLDSSEVTEGPSSGNVDNHPPPIPVQPEPCVQATYSESGAVYSVTQMAAAVVTSILVSLVLGALIGHVISRLWANRQTDSEPFSGKDYASNSKMQNAYEVDSSFHPAERQGGQLEKNFVCNQLKENGKRPNGSADNRLAPKSTNKVYV